MALEVIVGADIEQLKKGIAEAELEIERLKKKKIEDIKLGLDVTGLQKQINESKTNLSDLKKSLDSVGKSAEGFGQKVKGGGNTLTQFGRIAQDFPFGIQGIGNNITATAEAFSSLSKEAGGAGNAFKAVGASLLGGGGVLLAVSLVTAGLTYMSQKGITVGDVFDKLTGTFDGFSKALSDANREAAKNAAEEIQSVKSLVEVAKDHTLSMQERLIAVKKLQDEYPAYFGNLKREEILNGNVSTAVKDVIEALKAKARAQAYSSKLGELAAKEVELEEKKAPLLKQYNQELENRNRLESLYGDMTKSSSDRDRARLYASRGNVLRLGEALKEVESEINANSAAMDKWAAKSNIEVKASIKLDFDPEKVKKGKKVKQLHEQLSQVGGTANLVLDLPAAFDIGAALNEQYKSTKFDPYASLSERMEKSRADFINRLMNTVKPTVEAVYLWRDTLSDAFASVGDAIGQALASGGNVLEAVGMSLLSTLGSLLSDIGKKLIVAGAAAVAAGTVMATLFTPAGIGAGIAAIGVGTALVAGGSLLGGISKGGGSSSNKQISSGADVRTPSSSISNGGGSGGFQNVVFEISGQSLVGVLSNTLNKNIKLGGMPQL